MDALRPGHAHRSSSDRLLNNYLDSQKHLTQSLLTLLSHSHSSTSSLLAYVTSSPGVNPPIRTSVRHAAFEGPLSASLVDSTASAAGSQVGSIDTGTPGWAAYVSSLEQFRKDLKQIHLLEEELSRVKRDREILVTRLIKTTKSRPSKSDLSAIASAYTRPDGSVASSRASQYSVTSDGSNASGKEGKRATKLAEAQAELLGCEEHLRGLEVRIESERNRVMSRGLGERFRAMEVVGQMWVAQARRGLDELERLPDHAFELDSNGSIAPSQSASQIGYDENQHSSPLRNGAIPKHISARRPPGSITGSIVEEDEDGSSGDDVPGGQLIVHENNRAPKAVNGRSPAKPTQPSPLGVPSINTRARPLSSTFGGSQYIGDDSDSDDGSPANRRAGGRRAASDVGAMGYHPPKGRTPLRRTFSEERGGNQPAPRRAASDTSSIGGKKKKKGFFASISRFFKGNRSKREGSIRSGRSSPPYGSGSAFTGGKWQTRTDANIKRGGSRAGRRGGDSSSDDETTGPLVSVSNNRNSTWSVENVGRPTNSKRSSTPIAPGLIPKPRPVSRAGSTSTVTARNPGPRPASTTQFPQAAPLSRSNTVKSTASTGTSKRIRKNGSISRTASATAPASEGRNIMSLLGAPPPAMPDVPKAPKSQVTPKLELPKAPGSSIVPSAGLVLPSQLKPADGRDDRSITPSQSISRSNSYVKTKSAQAEDRPTMDRPNTPSLPPSKTLSPPLKSAMRPTSPVPSSVSALAPPLELPTTLYSISAPGPVQVPREEPKPMTMPAAKSKPKSVAVIAPAAPTMAKRNSYTSATGDEASVYESAAEETPGMVDGDGNDDEDSSEEEQEIEGKYKIVENDSIASKGLSVGPPEKVMIPHERRHEEEEEHEVETASTTSGGTATAATAPAALSVITDDDPKVARRKSVRMAVPDSPGVPLINQSQAQSQAQAQQTETNAQTHTPAPVISTSQPTTQPPPSPPTSRPTDANWSTRIGRMREDSSEDEDRDEDYTKARRSLSRNSGKFEAVGGGKKEEKKEKGLKKLIKGSSKGSNKGSVKG